MTPETAFDELSARAQVHRLRTSAVAALAHYPIEVDRLRLVYHGFNTTFRVDATDGRRFALRLNVNSRRELPWIRAEIAWLAALADETDVRVPAPLPTRNGELLTTVHSPELGRHLPAVVYSWLAGPDLDDGEVGTVAARELGRTMAALHDHAERWSPPPDTSLPVFDEPLFGDTDRLATCDHPALTDDRREIFGTALGQTRARFEQLYAGARPIPLHADLHPANVKWSRGRLSVFDFDDSGYGVPALDLGITTYYLRDDDTVVAAVRDGYAERRPLPECTTAQFEAIVASRNLILLNDVVVNVNADIKAIAPTYIANSAARLRHYLDTGTYRFDVPGVESSG